MNSVEQSYFREDDSLSVFKKNSPYFMLLTGSSLCLLKPNHARYLKAVQANHTLRH